MISLEAIQKAGTLLAGRVTHTPLLRSSTLSRRYGLEVFLKLENQQRTGSFKARGATYKLLARRAEIGPLGVVTASAGNHAQGVALAASQAGVPALVVMPEHSSISKQEAVRAYGGRVVTAGLNIEESLKQARALAEEGRLFVHPFDDPDVIIGQGTAALEIFEDLPDPDVILAPIGGGGLIAGLAAAAHGLRPETRIVGVQARACPSALAARQAGRRVTVPAEPTIADGIHVRQVGRAPFEIIRRHVHDVVLVEEDEIARAILFLLERQKSLAEGAGAVTLAALLSGVVRLPAGSRVVLVISGGNLDSPLLGRIIGQGLKNRGRLMRLRVLLEDRPGYLAELLVLLARLQANVLEIQHDRHFRNAPLYAARVDLELETRGPDHIEEIRRGLTQAGYAIEEAG